MKYIVMEEGVYPLDSISEEDYLITDIDFSLLCKDRISRQILLTALDRSAIIIGRLGKSVKNRDGVYVSFSDEFLVTTIEKDVK